MSRRLMIDLGLVALVVWALHRVAVAGITGWPFNRVVYVHAGATAVLLVLAGLAAVVLAGIGWRPRA